MIIEGGVKSMRMGWNNSFIKGIILSDGTVLQNMQCKLDAKIPTDEELEKLDINISNSKQIENDVLSEYEYTSCRLEELTTMLWYIYEDYYALQNNDLYTKSNNYDRLGTFLINIHSLLYTEQEKMKSFIDKIYHEQKKNNK